MDSELIHISIRVLRDICKGQDPASLPPEVRAMLSGESPSRVLTMAQLELVTGMYASVPDYSAALASQASDQTVAGLDDLSQPGEQSLTQVITPQGQNTQRPQQIPGIESPSPMRIL